MILSMSLKLRIILTMNCFAQSKIRHSNWGIDCSGGPLKLTREESAVGTVFDKAVRELSEKYNNIRDLKYTSIYRYNIYRIIHFYEWFYNNYDYMINVKKFHQQMLYRM